MSSIIHFETFLIAGILLNLTPGNDTIFILTRSISEGRKAGIISALGIATGCIVHTVFAAFGLAFIIAKSILLFNIVKYTGAAYLIYIGYKMLADKSSFDANNRKEQLSVNYLKIYWDGIVTNVLNPKVALFFISFLPQFIDPTAQSTLLPFLVLGTTFIVTGLIWCLILATFASAIFSKLKGNKRISVYINRICGSVLIGLGIKVAISERV
jgi:RhtB (resistance to homoserine/threonine) family protein